MSTESTKLMPIVEDIPSTEYQVTNPNSPFFLWIGQARHKMVIAGQKTRFGIGFVNLQQPVWFDEWEIEPHS